MRAKKHKSFDEKSKLVGELCNQIDSSLDDARKEILKDLTYSIQKLKFHIDSDDDRVSLDAIKFHARLAGLEVEKIETSGNIFITAEREDKILAAAKL